MFSATVSWSSRPRSWCTTEIPAACTSGQRTGSRIGAAVDRVARARIRGVEAGEDLDERRLARSVLPGEAVDLAGRDGQLDIGQYLRGPEGLAEPRTVRRAGTGIYLTPQADRKVCWYASLPYQALVV